MKLTELEISTLRRAAQTHNEERTGTVEYLVIGRVQIEKGPFVADAEGPVIPWLEMVERNPAKDVASATKTKLAEWIKTHLPGSNLDARLRYLDDELSVARGEVIFSSDPFTERSEAEKLASEWAEKGISSLVLPSLPRMPHVFSHEALRLIPDFKDHVDVSLVAIGDIRARTPGSVELCLSGLEKAQIANARKAVDKVFSALEREGLAVRVKLQHLFWVVDGISLTRAGLEAVKQIEIEEKKPKEGLPEGSMILKCRYCGGCFYHTTETFNPDVPVKAHMFEILPKYGPKGLNWDRFHPNSVRTEIVCPSCQNSYLTSKGFLLPNSLIEPSKARLK